MSKGNGVLLSSDLRDFFREQVMQARAELGVKISEMSEFYLVNLLNDFSRPETSKKVLPIEQPLAFMYQKAMDAEGQQRLDCFKELGDVSLYIAGFFSDFVDSGLVDIDYYVNMGGGAYQHLSQNLISKPNTKNFANLYDQLARSFVDLVDVLNHVSEKTQHQKNNNRDLLKTYDRWLRTGSQRLQKQLVEEGLVPVSGLSLDYVQ